MRANPSASMQKTYDECFLTCSTAVYFEGQNNEAEALRSWKSALDQIYYHNAHRVSANYRPRSETERALRESLHQLELQCKERVDLLEALKRSREEAGESLKSPAPGLDTKAESAPTPTPTPPPPPPPHAAHDATETGWLGGGTVRPVDYTDICRPPLPVRPSFQTRTSSGADSSRVNSTPRLLHGTTSLSPGPAPPKKESRTPSPEKKSRMLRTLRPGGKEGRPSSSKMPLSMRNKPPAAAKAATQAWGTSSSANANRPVYLGNHSSRESIVASQSVSNRPSFDKSDPPPEIDRPFIEPPDPESYQPQAPFHFRSGKPSASAAYTVPRPEGKATHDAAKHHVSRKDLPSPSARTNPLDEARPQPLQNSSTHVLAYRNEYPTTLTGPRSLASSAAARSWTDVDSVDRRTNRPQGSGSYLSSPANTNRARKPRQRAPLEAIALDADGESDKSSRTSNRRKATGKEASVRADIPPTTNSEAEEDYVSSGTESDEWKEKVLGIMKNLSKGVDESAARQILNEIVIHGDEVHWDDVAGLDVAKSALKENVVYPFLRPDLFMGLREPARGMLLFGPPGTGKTMLARAVATESRSTFFAISASSLTSKFLGESEKLVRALFALAKMLAPSIIFVDEIDSLLSSRSGSGEHEATRRIKTEFLIQWSDLQKAAAGREQTERDKERGDASRVLVLAATNLPWAIDEAARRRFVRRQYIPLPEDHVRKTQLKTLLSHQKHELRDEDMDRLVELTDGFSGSDITALAKDAAMGPLRSLGEKLLHMTMDEIRPMRFEDFQASLHTIRPSVSKQGLKQFEDWAKEFGERGG
ncbi:P-loop containing nucleoside triphosphate hydrolase protein [Clohesyomyces aquaticus]|uniref:p-loop containing nucleoside triphosphate hydrolase protein n=1 Tax=Clohesyomyces aquaticus TaxID=1231657 RepID=A0A1Y2A044_9PLEO|nr:P-loop containing nucleoside triphosphate hydrolase protein [Clohesyomyces aquaticus]